MASRCTQEYFFQHTLMNVSFMDLNEVIHPMAEDIPEYIRHCASAMFVNESFWNDSNKVLEELKMEEHCKDYIDSYMSYVEMLKITYSLVTKRKLFLSLCCKSLLVFHKYYFILKEFCNIIIMNSNTSF